MNLLTPEIRAALIANMYARSNAQAQGEREPDPVPVARFFNPLGAATWLATELDEDGILFGLADLGLGCPELGSFSLRELQSLPPVRPRYRAGYPLRHRLAHISLRRGSPSGGFDPGR